MKKCPICHKQINEGNLRIHTILEKLAIETIKEIFPQLRNKLDVCLRYYHFNKIQARRLATHSKT